MTELVDLIRSNLSVDDALARSGVAIKRRYGRRLSALCPIHHEKTPSFVVYLDQWRAFCFGCSWSGDMIDLLAAVNRRTNAEMIHALAGEFGLLNDDSRRKKSAPIPCRTRITDDEKMAWYGELCRVRREMDKAIASVTGEADLDSEPVVFALQNLAHLDRLLERIDSMREYDFSVVWKVEQLIFLWGCSCESRSGRRTLAAVS